MVSANTRRVALAPLLLLGPIVVVLDWIGATGKLTIFLLAAAALVPLAWLIGEATARAAQYTGPGFGGLPKASFATPPELMAPFTTLPNGFTASVMGSL